MTDNEIIKALECCLADKMICEECPIQDECESHPFEATLAKHSLDLINRQQAEIERLKDYNKQLRYDRKQIASEAIKEFAEMLKSKKAEHYCKCGESFDYTDTLNAYVDNLVKEIVKGDQE